MNNSIFKKLYQDMDQEILANQKRVDVNTPIMVFYGISKASHYRLAFSTKCKLPKIEGTKLLEVTNASTDDINWLNIDLMDSNAAEVFYVFCDNLVNQIEGTITEEGALEILKKHFDIWKKMFKNKQNKMSAELVKGLHGELYVMTEVMFKNHPIDKVIKSWTGPEKLSKDFSYDGEWIEVKSTEGQMIEISSIEQLDSSKNGILAIVKLEKMSDVYTGDSNSLFELMKKIAYFLKDDSHSLGMFFSKLEEYGFSYNIENEEQIPKYSINELSLYNVTDDFPRIRHNDIKYEQIIKLKYQIVLKTLERFKR